MPTFKKFLSTDTVKSIDKIISEAIIKASTDYNVPVALIKAVMQTESGGDTTAMRYEPHLRKTNWYINTLSEAEKKNDLSYYSIGLMQVLFGVAKAEHGFPGGPMMMADPNVGIELGSVHLSKLLKRYSKIEDAVSSYNQGNPARDHKGHYRNQAYVNRVMRLYRKYNAK